MMKVVALGLLLAVMALLLRSFGFRGAAVFASFAVAAVLSLAAGELGELFGFAENSPLFGEETLEYVSAIVKIVGAGYLFGICADICTELGEGGIAKAVTVSGRIEIFMIAAPYFLRILRLAEGMLV